MKHYRPLPLQPRTSCLNRFLFVRGLLVTITLLAVVLLAIRPFLPALGLGIVGAVGFLVLAGLVWCVCRCMACYKNSFNSLSINPLITSNFPGVRFFYLL